MLPLRGAILTSYVGGWLVLPVGSYAHYQYGFTIEVIGSALPAPAMLVSKAWVAPVVPLVLAALKGRHMLLSWRPGWVDLPIALWCLCPLVLGITAVAPSPTPLMSCAYLTGVWGAPWLLARIYLNDDVGRVGLARALALGAVAIAPLAMLEGVMRPYIYNALYGTHPFASDGVERYVGFRPLLLFENGNQYGIYMALSAVAATAVWQQIGTRWSRVVAIILIGMAILSQSVGAIILMIAGLLILLAPIRGTHLRHLAVGLALLFAIAAPVYISGVIPIEAFVRHTAPGQKVLALVRASGRGSIAWRVSQDQKVASLVRLHPLAGASQWDWWRPSKTRPWNLTLLIIGQFGLLGFAAAATILILPSWQTLTASVSLTPTTYALALLALLASVDALLNAFVFLPAVAVAGSIVNSRMKGKKLAIFDHRDLE